MSQFESLKVAANSITLTKEMASQPTLKKKNRYKNILPYDVSRVILSGEGDESYINACYVHGYSKSKKFIATQGPLSSTVGDFWRMVVEERCTIIIMLTKCTEGGKRKCEKYWPDQGTEKAYGVISVKTDEETKNGSYIKRTFQVSTPTQTKQTVHHFHFITWPDHGVPATTSRLFRLFKEVSRIQTSAPIIVHCSAGAGRTGAYIAFDYLSEEGSSNQHIDVYKCVGAMREQRVDMVQNIDQYILVHKLLAEDYEFKDTSLDEVALREILGSENESQRRIKSEFEKLSLVHPQKAKKSGQDAKYDDMNRNPEIIPYERNRVILVRMSDDVNMPYINASHIQCYDDRYNMIAAQGPTASAVEYFWRAVLGEKVDVIVMLTEHFESDMEQCSNYWAENGEDFSVGNLSIRMTQEIREERYFRRRLMVRSEEISQVVDHYQYTTWSSRSPPSNTSSILDLVSKIHEYSKKKILIHCSDGAGRTGTFCAISNLIQQWKEENRVDVFRAVKDLRDCRPGMVQTLEEYRFCYTCILAYLDSLTVYENIDGKKETNIATNEALYENVHFKGRNS